MTEERTRRMSDYTRAILSNEAKPVCTVPAPDRPEVDNKDVLLRAAYDLLTKCSRTLYVLDVTAQTSYYNGGQHDGRRLRTDIAAEIGLDGYEDPIEAPR